MTDKISRERRSENMRAIRSAGSKPEMTVRRLVHGMGYRYRLHGKHLPGKPDLVFALRRKVIFVHGCFWHQHPISGCRDARPPKSNLDYWQPKLARNKQRDLVALAELKKLGWSVCVIWECQTQNVGTLERCLKDFLG